MMKKSRRWLLALLMCCSMAMLATGCEQLKKEPETEEPTEAPTEEPTEAPTEEPTEAPTEEPTEAPTEEPETEPQTYTLDTTLEEEEASQVEYDTIHVMYALDDLNVRSQPSTDGEIMASFTTDDQISVVGETSNWYMISLEDYEANGYVYKEFVGSEDSAASGSSEAVGETGVSDTGESAVTGTSSASSDTSGVDAEYGVETYADPFTVTATAGANMRSEPSQDGEIIGTIASDTQVTAIGYTDRWYKISYNGTVGYVNRNLFSAE